MIAMTYPMPRAQECMETNLQDQGHRECRHRCGTTQQKQF